MARDTSGWRGAAARLAGLVVLALAVPLGMACGFVAFFGAAYWSSQVPALGAAGLASCAGVAGILGWSAALLRDSGRRRTVAVVTGATAAIVLTSVASATIFKGLPSEAEVHHPTAATGIRFWNLPTGSRIAYRKLAAGRVPPKRPVVYLHGGPGAGIVSVPEVAQAFAFVAELGHDVYLYDQVGGGRSSRLADIRGYTVERHVADLEAIRRQLGPGPLTLVGESWGAQLAAQYLAAHPDQVARCILISPGPLYRAEWGASDPCDLKSRASARNRDEFERLLKLRLFAADLLLDVNPSAAHAFLPDAEADAYARRLFSLLLPGTLCEPDRPPPQVDFGLWANIVLERELMRRKVRIDRQLRATRTPFLILRGACDYCRAAVAEQYRDLIPSSRLVAIEGAGHLIWMDQPARFAEALRPFLLAPEPEAPVHPPG